MTTTRTDQTGQQIYDSLTGFEELAINRAFKAPVEQLEKTMLGRALVFILNKRDGMKDSEAKEAALALTISTLNNEIFKADDDPESDGEDEGKDD